MSRKPIIIALIVIFSIFIIGITVIFIQKHKSDEIEEPEQEHHYAINETKDRDELEEESIETEIETIVVNDTVISYLERLTPEQHVLKNDMISLLNKRVTEDEFDHGDAISANISENSTKYQVYVDVQFSDGESQIYVVNYDATSSHKFLRCVTLEEWEYYNSGENAG